MEAADRNNNFEQCIKCTVCTVYCPVLKVNPSFPGPKHGGPDHERLRLKNPEFYDEALKYCLNCKRCEVACPSNVKIGDIIQSACIKRQKKSGRIRDFLLAHTDFMGTVAASFAPIVNPVLRTGVARTVLDSVLSIDHHRVFPEYTGQKFETWMKKQAEKQSRYPEQVSYFHGCYVNYNNPQQGKDLVKILNAMGIGVQLLKNEKCCGVPLISNGYADKAKKNGRSNLKAIRESVTEKNIPVVATSSSCTFTLRDEYPHLLELDNADVREHIEYATRYIYRRLSDPDRKKKLKFANRKLKVVYHVPCHMKKMGWEIYTIELLKLIPGIELTVLDSDCCGIAGTYGFKKENYEASQEIGKPLFERIEQSGADCIVSDCETCKWQIEMSTSQSCLNPLSLMAQVLTDEMETPCES
ncbi:MAG: anaerobic glycerol-3-phosphate dehydrogenase subunit C [Tannerella sp.]|jgi:glycerol-3-phosphate dehydrogenase subunit C|nr:anaerobic glycerol-3-phosphate dehydrogenase subunit C [Tannerella sp.]